MEKDKSMMSLSFPLLSPPIGLNVFPTALPGDRANLIRQQCIDMNYLLSYPCLIFLLCVAGYVEYGLCLAWED